MGTYRTLRNSLILRGPHPEFSHQQPVQETKSWEGAWNNKLEACSYSELSNPLARKETEAPESGCRYPVTGVTARSALVLNTVNGEVPFTMMVTGAFSRNVGKLFSELKLATVNLLFIYAQAN